MKRDANSFLSKDTVIIMDFDGTLYRGSCPFLLRGIANADLMAALCLLNVFKVSRFCRFLGRALRLGRFEYRMRRAYRAGKSTLSEADMRSVRFFEKSVVAYCTQGELDRAVRMISRFCYCSAWRCLDLLKNRCDFVIVSKSFEFLLEQVCRRAALRGLRIEYYGNRFRHGGSFNSQGSVITAEDKRSSVHALLSERSYRHAVVIGDTEDDTVMRDAAVGVLGLSEVLFLCLHAKDRHVADAANHVFSSWCTLGKFLDKRIGSQGTPE